MSIIPIRCFTCGKILANKYRFYQERVAAIQQAENLTTDEGIPGQYYQPRQAELSITKPTAIRRVCDQLQLERCCVKTIMTHVDIE